MSDLARSPAPPPSPDEPQSLAQPPRNSGVLERMLADMHRRVVVRSYVQQLCMADDDVKARVRLGRIPYAA